MKSSLVAASLAASLVLSACSSSGGSDPGPDPDPDPTPGTSGLFASYIAEQDGIVPEFSGMLPDASLPTTGSADYAGVMTLTAFGGTTEFEIRGDMTATVDFAGNAVSGEATDFVDVDDRAFAGTIALENGALDRAAADPQLAGNPGLTGDLVGVLESPDLGSVAYEVPFVATAFDGATYLNGNGVTPESSIIVGGAEDGNVVTSFVLEAQ